MARAAWADSNPVDSGAMGRGDRSCVPPEPLAYREARPDAEREFDEAPEGDDTKAGEEGAHAASPGWRVAAWASEDEG